MKNMRFILFGAIALTLSVTSCIEHEVIPAPVPTVDKYCHFEGLINGISTEFTENVSGYYCSGTKAKYILPAPAFSSAVYYSEMLSPTYPVSIRIGLGSLQWDAALSAEPSLSTFNDFHMNNTTPAYSNSAANGFEVAYKDGSGLLWTSKQTSPNFQDVTLSAIKQGSDATGDYSRYVCTFNCYVYRQDPVTLAWDSIRIQNAELKGFFKR
jgi:hypothetical protein